MSGYDIVSFDLDGTLVDTAGEIAEAVNRALQSCGIDALPVAQITRFVGRGTQALIESLLHEIFQEQPALIGKVAVSEVHASMARHYAETTGTMGAPYPGALEALEMLRMGGVRLACVTNKELRHARRVLSVTRMEPCFEMTIGGDSLPCRKPHESVLKHVMHSLGGCPERTAHVGDSRIDVQAARNAGVTAWAVPYGYNGGVPVAESMPDRVFNGLLPLARHVIAGREQ